MRIQFTRIVAGLLLAFACIGSAQVSTSTAILGQVTDSSSAVAPGATVTIKNVATGESRSTTTDSSGLYAFPSVVPGVYDITVSHAGFRTAQMNKRVVEVAQSAQVDVVLQVGEATQSVTVSGEGAELISTVGADVSATVSYKLIQDLPLNGHNFFDLTATLPFVSPQNLSTSMSFASGAGTNGVFGGNPANPFFRSSGVFAAGNRDSATNVSLDGANIQQSAYRQTLPQQPNSAIQEVRIEVSTMNAEFGYGAAAVNVVTKNGSNEIHGELSEYLHNSATDANSFFNNSTRTVRPPWRQNQFGAALGAPVIKNKVFVFGAYEGLRIRRSIFGTQAVPPAEIRGGDFSAFRPVGAGGVLQPTPIIYDPANFDPATGLRSPFPGNRIPANRLDPVTTRYLSQFVLLPETTVNGVPSLAGNAPTYLNQDMGTVRVDWTKSSAARIYGRYSQSVSPSESSNLQPLQGAVQDSTTINGVIHWTQILSSAMVNDLFVGYSKPVWEYHDRPSGYENFGAAIGLKNTVGGVGLVSFGAPSGFNLGNPGVGGSLHSYDNVYQLGDDITLIRGRHSLKFGFSALERRLYHKQIYNATFGFAQQYTTACPAGRPACTAALGNAPAGGYPFAEYLLGATNSYNYTANGGFYRGYQRYYGLYAQDSWRVSTKLTLNYGLRYERWKPWFQPRHTTANFDVTTGQLNYVLQNPIDYLDPSKGYGRDAPLNPNVPEAGYTGGTKDFGPRVGLAYMITPHTVFRAGYGIYYDGNINMNQWQDISTAMPPFRLRDQLVTSTGDQVPTLYVRESFPHAYPNTAAIPNANPPFTFRAVMPYNPDGSVQEWSASVQHRIGSNWVTEVAYQGTHAIHLNMFVDQNAPALPQGSLATVSLQNRRRFPQWGIVGTWTPIGYSRYHAGSVSLRNNPWHGMTLSTNFTWAKNIGSSILAASDQGNQAYYAPYIWEGPIKLSPRLRYVTTYSYDLPFGPGKALGGSSNRVLGAVLGGWNFSGILDLTTGSPDYVTTADTSGTGYGQAPNRVCDARDVPGGRDHLRWFNVACFSQPAFGTFGNSPFGVFEDPGIANWNIAIAKKFKVGFPKETGLIDFRVDMFNALNHTQWAPPTINVAPGTAGSGSITSTRPPRQVQFALRYVF